jgi:hypothetical protein
MNLAKRKIFNLEGVLAKEKKLTKKICKFCQETKILVEKRYIFSKR